MSDLIADLVRQACLAFVIADDESEPRRVMNRFGLFRNFLLLGPRDDDAEEVTSIVLEVPQTQVVPGEAALFEHHVPLMLRDRRGQAAPFFSRSPPAGHQAKCEVAGHVLRRDGLEDHELPARLEQLADIPHRAHQVLGRVQHAPRNDHVVAAEVEPLLLGTDLHVERLEDHPLPERLPPFARPFQEGRRHVRVSVLGELESTARLLQLLQRAQDAPRHASGAGTDLKDAQRRVLVRRQVQVLAQPVVAHLLEHVGVEDVGLVRSEDDLQRIGLARQDGEELADDGRVQPPGRPEGFDFLQQLFELLRIDPLGRRELLLEVVLHPLDMSPHRCRDLRNLPVGATQGL